MSEQKGFNPNARQETGSMRLLDTLEDLPITFDEEQHAYTWEPTGEVMSASVTRICSASKDAKALANIERTRHIWEARGKHVHAVLESYLSGEQGPYADCAEEYAGPFPAYCKPVSAHPTWEIMPANALKYKVFD